MQKSESVQMIKLLKRVYCLYHRALLYGVLSILVQMKKTIIGSNVKFYDNQKLKKNKIKDIFFVSFSLDFFSMEFTFIFKRMTQIWLVSAAILSKG